MNDLHRNKSVGSLPLLLANASARETAVLTADRFDRMIEASRVATFVQPNIGLAFDKRRIRWRACLVVL